MESPGRIKRRQAGDTFYRFAKALAGQKVPIRDKIENIQNIDEMCKQNGEFYVKYCSPESPENIWETLWIADISNTLPNTDVRGAYFQALKQLNTIGNQAQILEIATKNNWEKVQDWLVVSNNPSSVRARLIARSRRYKTS